MTVRMNLPAVYHLMYMPYYQLKNSTFWKKHHSYNVVNEAKNQKYDLKNFIFHGNDGLEVFFQWAPCQYHFNVGLWLIFLSGHNFTYTQLKILSQT